jgi:lysophospholipase L1-like esterase
MQVWARSRMGRAGIAALLLMACGGGSSPSDSSADGAGASAGTSAGSAGDGIAGSSARASDSFALVVIGSSTAAGEGASGPSNAWVARVQDALSAVTSIEVDDLAVDGYTTDDLASGSGASGNIDDAIDEAPDLIVVALAGSNDIDAGTSSSQFLSRLAALRDAARRASIPTFFVSTAPKDLSDDERQQLADWASAMNQRFGSCWVPGASAYAPCFIDVFDALADASLDLSAQFDSGDGIHLNDAGHAVVFRAAEPILQQYVCQVRTCR